MHVTQTCTKSDAFQTFDTLTQLVKAACIEMGQTCVQIHSQPLWTVTYSSKVAYKLGNKEQESVPKY